MLYVFAICKAPCQIASGLERGFNGMQLAAEWAGGGKPAAAGLNAGRAGMFETAKEPT